MLTHLAGLLIQFPFLRKLREDSDLRRNLGATSISANGGIVLVNINLGPSHQDPGIADRRVPPRKPSTVSGRSCLCLHVRFKASAVATTKATHRATVSLSPTIQRCRLGRVIATIDNNIISCLTLTLLMLLPETREPSQSSGSLPLLQYRRKYPIN